MSRRLGQPFPEATPHMKDAYGNAAYVQVAFNAGLDPATGEMIVDLDGTEIHATLGELMDRQEFYVNQAPPEDSVARINLAFMLGYLSAKIEEIREA